MSEPAENLEPPEPTPIPTPLEAHLYPDSCAAWTVTVTVTPGSASAKVLALLDPGRLTQAGRVDALVALERLIAWAQAGQTRVLAAMADDPFTGTLAPSLERDWVKEDVRAALGESSLGATARLRDAAQLAHELPDTLDALEHGRIRIGHARAVAEMVCTLDADAARQVEQAVLPGPQDVGPDAPMPVMASFRRKLRRAVMKADPRTAEEKAARAVEDRDVWVMPQENAMAFLGAPLPAEGAETVYAAVSAKADRDKLADDARTKAQRRADALVELCADYLAGGVKIENDTAAGSGPVPRYHGLRRRSRCRSRCPRCWAWTSSPVSWTGTARSPPRSRSTYRPPHGPGPVRDRPRPHMPSTRLQPARRPIRPAPHPAVVTGR